MDGTNGSFALSFCPLPSARKGVTVSIAPVCSEFVPDRMPSSAWPLAWVVAVDPSFGLVVSWLVVIAGAPKFVSCAPLSDCPDARALGR